jgi:hypothetical protein
VCDFEESLAMACDVGLAFDADEQQCIWADQNKCPKAFHVSFHNHIQGGCVIKFNKFSYLTDVN